MFSLQKAKKKRKKRLCQLVCFQQVDKVIIPTAFKRLILNMRKTFKISLLYVEKYILPLKYVKGNWLISDLFAKNIYFFCR